MGMLIPLPNSLLAREINWLETYDKLGSNVSNSLSSLLAREINWLETLVSSIASIGNVLSLSLLAREINWLETRCPTSADGLYLS